jgi:hypothetical protein
MPFVVADQRPLIGPKAKSKLVLFLEYYWLTPLASGIPPNHPEEGNGAGGGLPTMMATPLPTTKLTQTSTAVPNYWIKDCDPASQRQWEQATLAPWYRWLINPSQYSPERRRGRELHVMPSW